MANLIYSQPQTAEFRHKRQSQLQVKTRYKGYLYHLNGKTGFPVGKSNVRAIRFEFVLWLEAIQFLCSFQFVQLIWLYFAVGFSTTTSNFTILCVCTGVVCVSSKHPRTIFWVVKITVDPWIFPLLFFAPATVFRLILTHTDSISI